jgi:ubiquinone/menaquinone biosynthesis C-methylase UbiE
LSERVLTRAFRHLLQPAVYELAQRVLGGRTVHRRVAEHAAAFAGGRWVIDIGGGAGALGDALVRTDGYVCVDLDLDRLRRFRRKHPEGRAVVGDAARVPVPTGAIDTVLCAAMSHHLTDELLETTVREMQRVLRSNGRLVFMDAVWVPHRMRARLLWRCDQGSHPRTAAVLRGFLARHFEISTWEELAVVHEYIIAVATPRAARDGVRADGI